MRRVVSGSKVGHGTEMQEESSREGYLQLQSPNPPQSPAAFVEPEELSDAPMQLIGESNDCCSSSSLSDDSENHERLRDVAQDMVLETDSNTSAPPSPRQEQASPPTGLKRNGNFRRTDSTNDSSSGSQRASMNSQNSSRDWGWFEDVHQSSDHLPLDKKRSPRKPSTRKKEGLVPQVEDKVKEIIIHSEKDTAVGAVTAPNYVLEESLSSQKLWKYTAGNRPPQPVEERAFFEKMWAQNFQRSEVEYKLPVEVLTAASPLNMSPFAEGNFESGCNGSDVASYNLTSVSVQQDSQSDAALADHISDLAGSNSQAGQVVVNQTVKGSDSAGDMTVLIRGDNVFGTTVSKSFPRFSENGGPITGVDTVNISVASYRVVESKKGKHAQFLVIYREGSIRDTVGHWKRYKDFERLAQTVTQAHEGCVSAIANMSPLHVTEEAETEHLPNAITSWRLLKKRQRWYRCLDAGYLSLKVFLLERFLHDILFESTSSELLREFVEGGEDAPSVHGEEKE